MTVTLGTVIADRYVLADRIGTGGTADVFRSTDRILERDVALKLLRTTSEDPQARARFAVEAKTLAVLNHPGLVTVLDAGIDGDQPFLVMELIDGPNLSQQLRSEGALPAAQVRELGVQLAEAVAYAHDRGVVHRDIKPGNILLRTDGRAVLTDFGIARLLSDPAQHTQAGDVIGSPAYLSPEQVTGGDVTPAVDIYALGLVLLELSTGIRAFPGPSIEAAIARLSTPPAIPVSLDRRLQTLLSRMTALDPAQRPLAREVAEELGGTGPALAATDAAAATGALETAADPATTTGAFLPFADSGATQTAMLTQASSPAATRTVRKRVLVGLCAAAAVFAVALTGLAQLGPEEVTANPTDPISETSPTSPAPKSPTAPETQAVVAVVPSPVTKVPKTSAQKAPGKAKKAAKSPKPPKAKKSGGKGKGPKK